MNESIDLMVSIDCWGVVGYGRDAWCGAYACTATTVVCTILNGDSGAQAHTPLASPSSIDSDHSHTHTYTPHTHRRMPPPPSSSLVLVVTLTAVAAVALTTPQGQAWARRVWEGDVEGARKRKAVKQLRFLQGRLKELAAEVEVRFFGWD